jgi:hypothetical protein
MAHDENQRTPKRNERQSGVVKRYRGTGKEGPRKHLHNPKITVEHALWTCKETEQKRKEMNMNKNIWNEGR